MPGEQLHRPGCGPVSGAGDEKRRWDDSSGAAVTWQQMILDHDRDIDSLKAWRNELRGALALVKLTLGASLVSGIVAVLALVGLVAGALR